MKSQSIFDKYDLVDVDESFPIPALPYTGITLIVGSSGSGKTTILNSLNDNVDATFDDKPIYTNFTDESTAESLLIACGLRSVPVWKRGILNVSNGERHRAEIALSLDRGSYTLDEFTSVVDRNTAKSLSVALSKYFISNSINRLVIASCHRDIIEWLCPDHIYDADTQKWLSRGCLRRPNIPISLKPCDPQTLWPMFRKHHYLSSKINKSCNAWVGSIGDKPVCFTSVIRFPNGNFSNGWREHRTVVLPEFQGLGIGNKVSEAMAEIVLSDGGRLFSKTSHPSMGLHREKSGLWKPTSKNKKTRADYINAKTVTKEDGHKIAHAARYCYSHEYIGKLNSESRPVS